MNSDQMILQFHTQVSKMKRQRRGARSLQRQTAIQYRHSLKKEHLWRELWLRPALSALRQENRTNVIALFISFVMNYLFRDGEESLDFYCDKAGGRVNCVYL